MATKTEHMLFQINPDPKTTMEQVVTLFKESGYAPTGVRDNGWAVDLTSSQTQAHIHYDTAQNLVVADIEAQRRGLTVVGFLFAMGWSAVAIAVFIGSVFALLNGGLLAFLIGVLIAAVIGVYAIYLWRGGSFRLFVI